MSEIFHIHDLGYQQPVTLTERVAYALCAHDVMSCEGRLNDDEFEALSAVVTTICRKIGSSHREIARFLGQSEAWVDQHWPKLRGFLSMERGLRERRDDPHKGFNDIWRMKIIRADWQSYMGAAGAAVSVLAEDPRAAEGVE